MMRNDTPTCGRGRGDHSIFARLAACCRPVVGQALGDARPAAVVEPVEPRRLLAVNALIDNGTLLVAGTDAAEQITVTAGGDVVVDGATAFRFDPASFGRMEINARGGDDAITNDTAKSALIRGEAGDDTITGGSGRDVVEGNGGNDTIDGRGGDDFLTGGSGNDTINGGTGSDFLAGNTGDDTLDDANGDGENDTLRGGDGADSLSGDGGDTLFGEAGRDILRGAGGGGGVVLDGGADDDDLFSGSDAKYVGGDGNDTIRVGGLTVGDVDAGAGNDTVSVPSAASAVIDAGPGDDTVDALGGGSIVNGGEGNDTLRGGAFESVGDVSGGPGDDVIRVNGGTADGGDGDDLLENIGSTLQSATLSGGRGDDTLFGSSREEFVGGPGRDTVRYDDVSAQFRPVVVTRDNLANDGRDNGAEGDNVRDDVEIVTGADVVNGDDGTDAAAFDEGFDEPDGSVTGRGEGTGDTTWTARGNVAVRDGALRFDKTDFGSGVANRWTTGLIETGGSATLALDLGGGGGLDASGRFADNLTVRLLDAAGNVLAERAVAGQPTGPLTLGPVTAGTVRIELTALVTGPGEFYTADNVRLTSGDGDVTFRLEGDTLFLTGTDDRDVIRITEGGRNSAYDLTINGDLVLDDAAFHDVRADLLGGDDEYVVEIGLGKSITSVVRGGTGDDLLRYFRSNGVVEFFGDAGNDTLMGSEASGTLRGGEGDDELISSERSSLFGEAGDDTLGGGAGLRDGGEGDDTFWVGSASQPGVDGATYRGGPGDDTFDGDGTGIGGVIEGGPGNDTVSGNNGVFQALDMGEGDDLITGTISGGQGDRTYFGGPGDDTFDVNTFDDFDGGEGDDRFVLDGRGNAVTGGPGRDTADYTVRVDPAETVTVTRDGVADDGPLVDSRPGTDNVLADVEVVLGADVLDGDDGTGDAAGFTETFNEADGNQEGNSAEGVGWVARGAAAVGGGQLRIGKTTALATQTSWRTRPIDTGGRPATLSLDLAGVGGLDDGGRFADSLTVRLIGGGGVQEQTVRGDPGGRTLTFAPVTADSVTVEITAVVTGTSEAYLVDNVRVALGDDGGTVGQPVNYAADFARPNGTRQIDLWSLTDVDVRGLAGTYGNRLLVRDGSARFLTRELDISAGPANVAVDRQLQGGSARADLFLIVDGVRRPFASTVTGQTLRVGADLSSGSAGASAYLNAVTVRTD